MNKKDSLPLLLLVLVHLLLVFFGGIYRLFPLFVAFFFSLFSCSSAHAFSLCFFTLSFCSVFLLPALVCTGRFDNSQIACLRSLTWAIFFTLLTFHSHEATKLSRMWRSVIVSHRFFIFLVASWRLFLFKVSIKW